MKHVIPLRYFLAGLLAAGLALVLAAPLLDAQPSIKQVPMSRTDLTLLSKNNGGKFPEMQVGYVIGMDTTVAAHGSKDMPVWGVLLREMEGGQKSFQQIRVYNMVKHIESMQK